MKRMILGTGLLLSLTACAEFPEVDAATSPEVSSAEYPRLLPFEDILVAQDPRATEAVSNDVQARAAALRSRADRLRNPVIDPASQSRMDQGVDTTGL